MNTFPKAKKKLIVLSKAAELIAKNFSCVQKRMNAGQQTVSTKSLFIPSISSVRSSTTNNLFLLYTCTQSLCSYHFHRMLLLSFRQQQNC